MLFQTLLSITAVSLATVQAAPQSEILARFWDEPDGTGSHEDVRNTACHNLIRLNDNVESVSLLKDDYQCSLYSRRDCKSPPKPQVIEADGPVDNPNVLSVKCERIPSL